MKGLLTLIAALLLAGSAGAQSVLAGGFQGMATINGTLRTATGTVPRNGSFVAAAKDGSRFFAVSAAATSVIYIIDGSNFALLDSMSLPVAVGDLATNDEADRLYAVSSRALYRINTASKSVVDSMLISPDPNAFMRIEERPNTKEIWVARDSNVYIVNYAGTPSVTPFKVAGTPDATIIKFTPGGGTAYIQLQGSRKVVRADAATRTVLGTTPQRSGSIGWPEVTADSARLWLLDINTPKVIIHDAITLAPLDSIDAIQPALNTLYRHPVRNEIWGVGHFPDSITVFDAATKAVLANIRITADPFFLAFGKAGATGVGNIVTLPDVQLFPNPARTDLTVQLPKDVPVQLVLSDAAGRRISTCESGNGWAHFSVKEFAAGTYFLTVYAAGMQQRTIQWVKAD